ncbi:uncharacterized protein NMK_2589 [Novimethylophilus kurashikiensis]|uniref:Polysaccharide biosynthesis protein n=1 Tax=Novimethylophilus kurashikiensis TaxID=1825523 RepID=A0A2R5FBR5_9PROT|nr:oligosaccharide flippase family protein [Novimethylophilus kurashikiensis]GBG14988.1 uncharacterized protein NMK_2589 [Novimethylophilus kurashikiensis]
MLLPYQVQRLINRYRHANWALTDQTVVSGSNFVTGVLLARVLGPEAFGVFVLLQALMIYVNSFQNALIFQPMMSAAPQMDNDVRSRYLQGVFALQLTLSCVLAVAVAIIALFAHAFGLEKLVGLGPGVIVALNAALLCFQLQDWQRRYYFVQEYPKGAFINDCISYGGQVVFLTLMMLQGTLSVASAFWVIAATSLAAFIFGFMHDRVEPVFAHAKAVLKEGWRTGRDYLMAWQLQWMGTQGVLMIGASAVGAQAAGGVRAAQNIVGPINILFQAMENVVPVIAARHFGHEGLGGLMHYMWRITAIGTALLLPVLIVLTLLATPLTHLLYGDSYADTAVLVAWQAALIFVQFYLRQVTFFLRTVKATGVIIRSGVVMSVVSILVGVAVVNRLQETGVMLALLSGTLMGLAYSIAGAIKVRQRIAEEEAPKHAPEGKAPENKGGDSQPIDLMDCNMKMTALRGDRP